VALEGEGGGDEGVPVGADALGGEEESCYVDVEEDGFEELKGGEDRVGMGGWADEFGEAVGRLVRAAFGRLIGLVLAFDHFVLGV
jgi:hypothetical protein